MPKKLKYDRSGMKNRKKTKLHYGIFSTHIELFDNRILTIEGCHGVTDYTDCYIGCRLKKTVLQIYGTELNILNFEEDRISVGGYFSQIEFCKTEG